MNEKGTIERVNEKKKTKKPACVQVDHPLHPHRHLDPVPSPTDPSKSQIPSQGKEDRRRQVEIADLAAHALVDDGDDGGFAAVGDADPTTALLAVVGVGIVSVGPLVDGHDGLVCGVDLAAGAEARFVMC